VKAPGSSAELSPSFHVLCPGDQTRKRDTIMSDGIVLQVTKKNFKKKKPELEK